MLSVNERAGAQLSGVDTDGEPIALSANESHIYDLGDGRRVVIAASPIYSPMFVRYCGMMRRGDLRDDPRFATAKLRREHLPALLAEIRSWIMTFVDLDELQAQVSEAGLAIGVIRTTKEFAEGEVGEGMGRCRSGRRSKRGHRGDAGQSLDLQQVGSCRSRACRRSRGSTTTRSCA